VETTAIAMTTKTDRRRARKDHIVATLVPALAMIVDDERQLTARS
jgi:hypothetical protein